MRGKSSSIICFPLEGRGQNGGSTGFLWFLPSAALFFHVYTTGIFKSVAFNACADNSFV